MVKLIRPSVGNIAAASAILQAYSRSYGATAASTHQSTAVLGIYAALMGAAVSVPAEYRDAIKDMSLDDVAGATPEDAPANGTLVPTEDYERMQRVLTGMTITTDRDKGEQTFAISEEALAAIGLEAPAGLFVPYSAVGTAVEAALEAYTEALDQAKALNEDLDAEGAEQEDTKVLDKLSNSDMRVLAAAHNVTLATNANKAATKAAMRSAPNWAAIKAAVIAASE